MTTTLRLWQIGSTEKAYLLSKVPKSRDPHAQGVWVPRSVIEHITRFPAEPNEWQEVHVKLPEWIAEKKGLL
jgi:hypothetical protein